MQGADGNLSRELDTLQSLLLALDVQPDDDSVSSLLLAALATSASK
jgi:hypothetical protein